MVIYSLWECHRREGDTLGNLSAGMTAAVTFALLAPEALAGSTTFEVLLDPEAVVLEATPMGRTRVSLPGAEPAGAPGEPLLPSMPVTVPLPRGAREVEVTVEPSGRVLLARSGLTITPARELLPLLPGLRRAALLPDPAVYGSASAWPESIAGEPRVGSLAGFPVASVMVTPWRYVPSEGSLELITGISVTLTWDEGAASPLTGPQREVAMERLSALATHWPEKPRSESLGHGGASEYLVVCDSAHAGLMQPLADLRRSSGMGVEVATVEDALSAYPAGSPAESVRELIRDRYLTAGTVYVLLAGDETLVPALEVYTECEGFLDEAPVDLYYSDLDGDWDASGDGIPGQPDDSLDLYSDVVVGRLLFATEAEAELLVSRSVDYQVSPPSGDWSRRAVLCGAVLFEELGYVGARGCDSLDAYLPATWDVTKAYEVPGGDYIDTHIPVINSGTGWTHYAGHGNERGIYWSDQGRGMMTSWMADTLENGPRRGIHTSIACHPGDYPEGESCAEALLKAPDGGAVSVFFNTSYGWEGHWPELGASEMMCAYMARRVFSDHDPTVGLAFATAKDMRVPWIEGEYDRNLQSILSWTAFTDPALHLLSVPENNPVPPVPLAMSAPWPNPATRDAPVAVMVDYLGGGSGPTEVSVHDMAGRLVWSTSVSAPGRVAWEGTGPGGRRVPAGVYIITARRGYTHRSRLFTILD